MQLLSCKPARQRPVQRLRRLFLPAELAVPVAPEGDRSHRLQHQLWPQQGLPCWVDRMPALQAELVAPLQAAASALRHPLTQWRISAAMP